MSAALWVNVSGAVQHIDLELDLSDIALDVAMDLAVNEKVSPSCRRTDWQSIPNNYEKVARVEASRAQHTKAGSRAHNACTGQRVRVREEGSDRSANRQRLEKVSQSLWTQGC